MTAKRLTTLAVIFGVASLITFGIGIVLLGAGIVSSRGGGSSLLSSDGPERAGYEDGHPVGLYLMTRYWIATGSLEKAVWYFTSDGRVYVDLEDGFSGEKLAAHKGQQGTVSVEGDQMTITWSDGKKSRGDLERGENGFNWDMGIFAPVEPFEDASALVGRWEGGHSSTFSGSTAITSRTLEFHADGSFSSASAASLRSESEDSVAAAGSTGSTAGQWKLDGYALVLTYNDGTVRRGITFPFDDEKTPVNPDRFYFGSTLYRKL